MAEAAHLAIGAPNNARLTMALLPVADALARILSNVAPVESELVAIDAAAGRTLAAPVAATRTQPPFPASAMDGYAVRSVDVSVATPSQPAILKEIGEAVAGQAFRGFVGVGETVRIMTGAPVPPGADSVQKIEVIHAQNGLVEIQEPTKPGQNITPRGVEAKAGNVMLAAGAIITPAAAAVLASFGYAMVEVSLRPRLVLLSTGSELVEVWEKPTAALLTSVVIVEPFRPGAARDSTRGSAAPEPGARLVRDVRKVPRPAGSRGRLAGRPGWPCQGIVTGPRPPGSFPERRRPPAGRPDTRRPRERRPERSCSACAATLGVVRPLPRHELGPHLRHRGPGLPAPAVQLLRRPRRGLVGVGRALQDRLHRVRPQPGRQGPGPVLGQQRHLALEHLREPRPGLEGRDPRALRRDRRRRRGRGRPRGSRSARRRRAPRRSPRGRGSASPSRRGCARDRGSSTARWRARRRSRGPGSSTG